jgi:hypothetical protein
MSQYKILGATFGTTNLTKNRTSAAKNILHFYKAPEDYIIIEDTLGGSKRAKKLKEFLIFQDYDINFAIKERSRNKNRKNPQPIPELPKLTHQDFWDWICDNYEEPEEIQKGVKYDLEIPDFVAHHAPDAESLEKLKDFLSSIPNIPTIAIEIEKFFSSLSFAEFKEFFKLIKSKKDPRKLDISILDNPLLQKIFNIEPKEVGKAEILYAFLFQGCQIQGGSSPYDAVVKNSALDNTFELKAQDTGAYRVGKDNIRFFGFSEEFDKTFDITEKISKFDLSCVFSKDLRNMIQKILGTVRDEWERLEVNKGSFRDLQIFYFMLHSYFHENPPQNVVVSVFDPFTYTHTFQYESVSDIIPLFKDIKYVRDPDSFWPDLDKVPQEYFKKNGKVDYLQAFKENEITTSTEKDLGFYTITQGGVRIMETKYLPNRIFLEHRAWEKWKKDKHWPYEIYYNAEGRKMSVADYIRLVKDDYPFS